MEKDNPDRSDIRRNRGRETRIIFEDEKTVDVWAEQHIKIENKNFGLDATGFISRDSSYVCINSNDKRPGKTMPIKNVNCHDRTSASTGPGKGIKMSAVSETEYSTDKNLSW